MSTLDELKKMWNENQAIAPVSSPYDYQALEKIARSRTKKHINKAMQYFWAAFTLQILVYALLSHVMIKYGSDVETLLFGIAGVVLFLPFTIMLMHKFKQMAVAKPRKSESSLHSYVFDQHSLLQSFYRFKKRYELILIPLSSVIGVFLTFKLFVPGGVQENLTGAIITFAVTLISCILAIRSENRRNFAAPLHQLEKVMEEFEHEG